MIVAEGFLGLLCTTFPVESNAGATRPAMDTGLHFNYFRLPSEVTRLPTLGVNRIQYLPALRKELLEPEGGLGEGNVPTLSLNHLSPREGAHSG